MATKKITKYVWALPHVITADQKTFNRTVKMIESNQRMDVSTIIMKVAWILKSFYVDFCFK